MAYTTLMSTVLVTSPSISSAKTHSPCVRRTTWHCQRYPTSRRGYHHLQRHVQSLTCGSMNDNSNTGGRSSSTDSFQFDPIPESLNLRDIASASPLVQAGRVLRCANPLLVEEGPAAELRERRGVRLLLDLRAPTERDRQEEAGLLLRGGPTLEYSRAFEGGLERWRGALSEVVRSKDQGGGPAHRLCVSLLNRQPFYRGMFFKMPASLKARAVLYRVIGPDEKERELFLGQLNAGGLPYMYELILETAGEEVAAAMTVVGEAAAGGTPLLLFCKAGKDRTGIVTALTLAVCGVPTQDIVRDYARSDGLDSQLAEKGSLEEGGSMQPIGLDREAFRGAPAHVMEGLLAYIDAQYGSPAEYLRRVGFTEAQQAALRAALCATP